MVAALNSRAKKELGAIRVDPAGVPARPLLRRRRTSTHDRAKVPESAIQMVYRSGRQTAQKQLLDHYEAAGRTHIPIQLLVRDRTARQARQRAES